MAGSIGVALVAPSGSLRAATAASPERKIKTWNLRPHPGTPEPESAFNKIPRWFVCTLQFEKLQCSRTQTCSYLLRSLYHYSLAPPVPASQQPTPVSLLEGCPGGCSRPLCLQPREPEGPRNLHPPRSSPLTQRFWNFHSSWSPWCLSNFFTALTPRPKELPNSSIH